MLKVLKRILTYNGSMEYKPLSDEDIVCSYQHRFIVECYRYHIEGKKVLDAGCWTGPLERAFVEKGLRAEWHAVDENAMALTVAKRNFPNIDFTHCELNQKNDSFIEKFKAYFDTVFFMDVIEHIDPRTEIAVLQFFNKVLQPGGHLIVSTMSNHIFNFIDPGWFFGHRHYSLNVLIEIGRKAEHEVVDVKKIGNLWWDIDILLSYFYKYFSKKKYRSSKYLENKIQSGFNNPLIPVRYYLVFKKKANNN